MGPLWVGFALWSLGAGAILGVFRGRLARAEAAVMVELVAGVLLLVAVLCMPAACQSDRKGKS